MNLNPGFELILLESLSFGFDTNFYWRLETEDGIYGPSGNLLRSGAGTDERFVGTAISASFDWNLDPAVFLGLVYTHGFTGSFVRASGNSRDIDFVELTLQIRF
jgi:hypothetical protein